MFHTTTLVRSLRSFCSMDCRSPPEAALLPPTPLVLAEYILCLSTAWRDKSALNSGEVESILVSQLVSEPQQPRKRSQPRHTDGNQLDNSNADHSIKQLITVELMNLLI